MSDLEEERLVIERLTLEFNVSNLKLENFFKSFTREFKVTFSHDILNHHIEI